MAWKVEVSRGAAKELKKLDKSKATQVLKYLREIEKLDHPRQKGKELKGNLKSLWRYRIGDYRAICEIQDGRLLVLVLKIGHRKSVYL